MVHEKQLRDLQYDCKSIEDALSSVDDKLVLLKGGAYMQSQFEVGRGRLITDIDIIVPKAHIPRVERALNECGWNSSKLDPYNESYYRRWSHETPALINNKRGTTLDLHHNILPPTARPNVNADLLFDEIQELKPGVYALSPRDMILHSATHLFHEGEFHHGLRDLWDLDRMLREFSTEKDFWPKLTERAAALELQDSLYHALVYTTATFDTPVPTPAINEIASRAMRVRKPLMDFLFSRAFRPSHPDTRLPMTQPALYLLYLRSHYLRMPMYLLIPHLARKAMMRKEKKAVIETQQN
jgi:hypothetical protein